MQILRLVFFLICFFTSTTVKAVEIFGIEVKEYDNVDAYIIYHPDYFKIDVTFVSGVVRIKADYPVSFRKLTPVSIDALVSGLRNENSKTISFKPKEHYSHFEVVRGEKLTAIKFHTEKKFDKLNREVHALNKQEHNLQGIKVESKPSVDKSSEAKIKKTKDAIEVKFEFGSRAGASAFERDNRVWVAFDKKQGFDFPIDADIQPPKLIDINDATVLSFEIPQGYKPSLTTSDSDTWILSFKKSTAQLRFQYRVEKLFDHYGAHISGDGLKKVIEFIDPYIGDKVTMVTSSHSSSGISRPRYFSGFTIHKTIGGVAISWVEENYKVEFSKVGIEVYTLNNALFNLTDRKESELTIDYSTSSLPINFTIVGRDYNQKKAQLFSNIVKAQPAENNTKIYELASFFLKEKLYQEALASLDYIKYDTDFLESYPQAPLFKAVLLSLIGRYQDSESLLKAYTSLDISPLLKAEAGVWSNYNNIKLGTTTAPSTTLRFIDGFITNYPDDIYWKLLSAELELASNNNDLSLVEQLFRKVRVPNEKFYIDDLNYYKGSFYRKNKKTNLANNYYDAIKLDYTDSFQYVRKVMDQVEMMTRSSQIDYTVALNKLQELRYLWRGDKLEYQLLLKIAELQQGKQDYLPALRTYKYLLEAFPNDVGSVHISHQMAEIYNNFVFAQGGVIDNMSDFALISLYYEFRELTPIGEAGDKVVLAVAKRMINLDLLDNAESILSHQVRYRLSGKDRIVSGDHLAAIYILNKKPKMAIDVLNETDISNYGFLEHMIRLRVKAKAFLDLGDYQSALSSIKDDDSTDAKIIRLEIYFRMSDWENYVLTAESDIIPIISVGKQMPVSFEKETLRLAISYSMLGKMDEIKYLSSKLNTEDHILSDAVKLIESSNEKIDIRSLDSKFNANEVEALFKSIINKIFDLK